MYRFEIRALQSSWANRIVPLDFIWRAIYGKATLTGAGASPAEHLMHLENSWQMHSSAAEHCRAPTPNFSQDRFTARYQLARYSIELLSLHLPHSSRRFCCLHSA